MMDVTVSNSGGKLLYKGKTDVKGAFATKTLAPGNYVVQFNSKSSKGGPFAVVVSAGKKKVTAESVPSAKFAKGGVAMRVEVDKAMSLVGQVADVGQITLENGDQANAKGNGKVKYINGKKYVWVEGNLGSNLGGRWVEANSPEGQRVENVSTKALQDLQGRSQNPDQSGGG
jgi:hypothetical protein